MNDWQFLSIPSGADRNTIKVALINKIAELDFEIDIKQILQYVKTYHRLTPKTEETQGIHQQIAAPPEGITDEPYTSPEGLIARFEHIYQTPAIRFDALYWQLALDNVKKHAGQLKPFCTPVADFLRYHPFIKSEVLKVIANTFPFGSFFPDPREEDNAEFWQKYGLVYELLRRGNLELDLFADEVNDGSFTTEELDDIYNRLIHSARYFRHKQYPQAFNLLAEGISAEQKPLVCWQRELNVLYKAHVVEGEEKLKELFQNVLNTALKAYPEDEQLLLMRIRFIQAFMTANQCKGEIVATLKTIPYSAGGFYLLGQCYSQLGLYQAALLIFEALKEIEPLNLKNVVAHAATARKYADFRMNAPEDAKDTTHYLKTIKELVGFKMYDEVYELIEEAPQDHTDIKALTYYAEALEKYHFSGEKDKELLHKALSFAQDEEITRMIYGLYLHEVTVWEENSDESKAVFSYYEAFPDDLMANHTLGLYYFDKKEHEKAYLYLLRAHDIDPSHIRQYYILARCQYNASNRMAGV